jgi:transcriptional regulator with XRE-family HTH domain
MAIPFDEVLARFTPEQRAEIQARASKMIGEELNLRDVRESVSKSQAQIAEALGVEQAAVSRLERRADMYVSTLRKLIQAMGGELDVVARFPGRSPVRIAQFGGAEVRPGRRGRKKKSVEVPTDGA